MKVVKLSPLSVLIGYLFGHKHYVNIIGVRGTDEFTCTSRIHRTKADADKHRREIEETRSFVFIETITFRSREVYYKEESEV